MEIEGLLRGSSSVEKAAEEEDVEMKEGDKEDEPQRGAAVSPPPFGAIEIHRYFYEMTVEEQTAQLLVPLLAKITEDIGVCLGYPQYVMDGTISHKLSENEKATIESQIDAYVRHNRMKMMDEDNSFDVIAEEMCQELMDNSNELGAITFDRISGYKVPPPPPPAEAF